VGSWWRRWQCFSLSVLVAVAGSWWRQFHYIAHISNLVNYC
jgi:hypothetical protein